MDRFISEQAVIDAVSKACFELRGVFERCENAIKALPSAQPEQRWIPVDEGKPKDETACLVTYSNGLVEIATFVEDLYKFDEYDFHDKRGVAGWVYFDNEWGQYFDVGNVIAWMPLPKPYQSKK